MENENLNPDTGNEEGIDETGIPGITFEELPEKMAEACNRAGWDKLMPVQEKAMPYLLNGQDVMVQARTGSGKTGAFVLPLIEKLNANSPKCQTLVMVPTRELAKQVAQEARMLAGDNGIKVVAVYGGVGYKEQLDAFRDGAQLVVGTPGRILDHLMRRNLILDDLKVLIFDEADRMLSVGFYPDMVEVKRYLPRNLIGSFMFSATFPPSVLRLAEDFMVKPEFLSLSSDETNVSAISHQFVEVQAMGKERKLIKLIELENPSSAIIFSNTKRNVEFTAALLSQFGFDAEGLTSDLTQNKRERLMTQIKEGKLRFLVATDVAARGIDIPELSHVFMMEPPEDPESYVHRAGRTGRAGATGTAITLVDVIQKMELERIATRFKITFEEMKDPTEEDVTAIIEERLTAILEKRFRKLTNIQQERVSRFLPLAKKYSKDEESLALLAMLLDELYQPTLHGKPVDPTLAKEPSGNSRPTKNTPARKPQKREEKPAPRERTVAKRAPKPKETEKPVKKQPAKEKLASEPIREPAPREQLQAEDETASKSRPKPRRRRRRRKKPSSS
ncbi:DEAD/DEAH box helicase [Pseudodesulfovibrio nedwellii]|uniref:DEAD/DEAH box helicase n=1 Tax=Pseudodesulfovibrio nedwellii TaxID=2973072 RepID=A0ABN6S144_9BACT|nr:MULTISPECIES: DEAD/DEAH box helicase [Pseudodesulfovibrio]BDQ36960.1 DEAD/DEAH box helicase [Pseudodesulfovibrio nedwellii]